MSKALSVTLLGVWLLSTAYPELEATAQPNQAAKRAANEIIVGDKTLTLKDVYVKKLEKIKKTGVTVFYPTFVPARYTLSAVTISDSPDGKPNYDYALQFCDKKHLCFSIESASWGIGDAPDGDRTLKGTSKVLGPFDMYVFKPGSEGNATKLVYYLSSWIEWKKKPVAQTKGNSASRGRYYHFFGNGVTDKEAVAIVESLLPIN